MNPAEHPLTGFFDAVRHDQLPNTDDIDEIVGRVIGDELVRTDDHLSKAAVRTAVVDTVRRMAELYSVGQSGDARNLSREVRDRLIAGLPPYRAPSRNEGVDLRQAIADMPR